jgi:hypothetical protein
MLAQRFAGALNDGETALTTESVRLPLMQFDEIERLASNRFNPRLDEQRLAFRGTVQAVLGQAASRGTVHSPPTYGRVEKIAQQELEQRGQTMLDGYKQALTATPTVVSHEIAGQIKQRLDAALLAEAEQVHLAIGYVRDALKLAQTKSAAELCARPLQKLAADLELFVAQLNTERGVPTLGWRPTLAKMSTFAPHEQG